MSMLGKLKTEDDIEEAGDSIGGGFSVMDSGPVKLKAKLAYLSLSSGEAMALNVTFDAIPLGEDFKPVPGVKPQELRQQFWMTSGKAKGCLNYYINKKTQAKHYLPGFNQANALCLLTIGIPIADMKEKKGIINLYDYDLKKDVPTEVDVLPDLIGKEIIGGVIKMLEDKNKLNTDTGEYEPTGETRESNEVDKLFRVSDGLTVVEIKAGVKEATFLPKWTKKWVGEIKDKTSKDAVKAGGVSRAVGKTADTPSLFA